MSDLNSYEKGLANDLAKAQVRIEELEAAFNNLHREYNSRGDRIAGLEARLVTAEEIGRAFEEDAGQLRCKLEELLVVAKRAVRLSLDYPDFKLYAMEPMERAIAAAELEPKP
jgi:chromosome segregation ATPase